MNYKELITKNPVELIEFYASWCPHCQRMMPIVEKIKELLGDQLPIYQFDIDENEALASEAGADSIPCFILISDGKEVWRHVGEMDGEELLRQIKSKL